MRILYWQITKELFSHGLLGLLLFTFVLFLLDTTRLLEMILRDPAAWEKILFLALLVFPAVFSFTIPIAVLVGTLTGLSRMASDGEVIALRAGGISTRQLLPPILAFALAGSAIALFFSAWLAPVSNRLRVEVEQEVGVRQIATELRPRVFEERFPNLILYVQDVISGPQPLWRGIFLADLTHPERPKITLSREGTLFSDPSQNLLQLHLVQGTIHETGAEPGEYSIASFAETDIPVRMPSRGPPSVKPNAQRSNAELRAMLRPLPQPMQKDDTERVEAGIELHRRFALPMAALFLTLIAIPLGLSSRRGGKASGIILTVLMAVGYYSLFVGGIGLARQGVVPLWAGAWGANLLFAAVGVILLSRSGSTSPLQNRLAMLWDWPGELYQKVIRLARWRKETNRIPAPPRGRKSLSSPFILDRYIVRTFLFYLLVVVFTLVFLIEIVTFFLDLLNDVVRNQIPAGMVIDYFVHYAPQLIYVTTPLAALIAILMSFAILNQNNEITAVKASGISLYRITLPLLTVAALLSVGLFLFEHFYVPAANRHQDAVRDRIKGRPAQTYYRPDRHWIVGEDSRIYYYNFFDPMQQVLGGVTIFDLDAETHQLVRRISAERAEWEESLSGWIFTSGWVRELTPGSVNQFEQFPARFFPELREPPSYFLKEVKQSTQMNFLELNSYMRELEQSGFDVVPLAVQLHRKFSFPLFVLILSMIGLPFAFSMGKRGALSGIALSIGIAMAFWATNSFFEALGNLNKLPPVAAAWAPDVLFGLAGLYMFLRIRT